MKFENVVIEYGYFNDHFHDGEYPFYNGKRYERIADILNEIGAYDVDHFYEMGGKIVWQGTDEEYDGVYW